MKIKRTTLSLDENDVAKLDKAVYQLSQKGIRVSTSLIARALIHDMPESSRLVQIVEKLRKHAPDGRTKQGRVSRKA